jgi:4-hydroxy-tetrahydrodipicolinate reductase
VIRICFAGLTGWTAPPIVAAIEAADDLMLTCGVSRSAAGRTLAEATATRSDRSIYASVSEALRSAEIDVVVDYTSASVVKENVWTAVQAGVHVVVGSSGLTADDYGELDRLARDRGVGVVAAGNFSVMAAILQRAAALAAEHLDSWEIVDYASADKPDVPSGTSAELAEILGKVLHTKLRRTAVPVERPGRGARCRGGRHPNPLSATTRIRGLHRDHLRWSRRAADHARRPR